jgi:hypothetical protein
VVPRKAARAIAATVLVNMSHLHFFRARAIASLGWR